jgi:hypothetical protein
MADVGSYRKNSDSGICAYSNMARYLEYSVRKPLAGTNKSLPLMIAGDEAFPLRTYLMRPCPAFQLDDDAKRIFNYRLSRARRTCENAFGILSQRFRLYQRTLQLSPKNADSSPGYNFL